MIKGFIHILIIITLTIFTQVGGLVWILYFAGIKWKRLKFNHWKNFLYFSVIYIAVIFTIVPLMARAWNKVPMPVFTDKNIKPQHIFIPLFNRHYVKKGLRNQLRQIAESYVVSENNSKLIYLDANFPLFNEFPLLPHLSHNDGKKIDFAFYYLRKGLKSHDHPSLSGYGVYAEPKLTEKNQNELCKQEGFWQYDFTKYFTFGTKKGFILDEHRTAILVKLLAQHPQTEKIFIEPHLKLRLGINDDKVRFHGCRAVRHDDHIHHQIY